MIAAIDTNILLDILGNDTEFNKSSMELLEKQSHLGNFIICPIVYSELLVFFLKKHDTETAISKLEEFLKDSNIEILDFTKEDFNLSAEAWQGFSNVEKINCPKCGAMNEFNCKECDSPTFWRNHLITDFLIGAHAQNHADLLATRDIGYYKKYFKLKTIS